MREERCERERQRKRKVESWQGYAVITSKRTAKSGKKILKSKGEEKGGEKISRKVRKNPGEKENTQREPFRKS